MVKSELYMNYFLLYAGGSKDSIMLNYFNVFYLD
jgi:hypothetical protein